MRNNFRLQEKKIEKDTIASKKDFGELEHRTSKTIINKKNVINQRVSCKKMYLQNHALHLQTNINKRKSHRKIIYLSQHLRGNKK